jgi:hypothetical protein
MKRQQFADRRITRVRWIRLLKGSACIREAANTAIAAKVMIERAILLQNNHNVLNVGELGTRSLPSLPDRGTACAAM